MSNQNNSSKPNFVFVIDANKQPLEPCSPTIAKKILKAGKAAVFRRYPLPLMQLDGNCLILLKILDYL